MKARTSVIRKKSESDDAPETEPLICVYRVDLRGTLKLPYRIIGRFLSKADAEYFEAFMRDFEKPN